MFELQVFTTQFQHSTDDSVCVASGCLSSSLCPNLSKQISVSVFVESLNEISMTDCNKFRGPQIRLPLFCFSPLSYKLIPDHMWRMPI